MNNEETLNVIVEAHEYCEKLYSGMGNLVNNISNRELNEVEVYFKNILEGFNWILDIALLCSDINNEQFDLSIVKNKINIYIDAYNNLDLLLLSDAVEYELMPQLEVFYENLTKTHNLLMLGK